MSFRLLTRPGHPTFLDLPLDEPMIDWAHERLVSPVRGLHRHVVVFVAYGDDMYALKELPDQVAQREYRNLRELVERDVPTVDAIGTITGRTDHDGDALEGIVITRHLDFSLPFRVLFNRTSLADGAPLLLDALAQLLVRIHLAGFYWGAARSPTVCSAGTLARSRPRWSMPKPASCTTDCPKANASTTLSWRSSTWRPN